MERVRTLIGKRGWIILVTLVTAAVLSSVGLAIASPDSNADNEAVCAVWDDPGSKAYQECLNNLTGVQGSGLVPGNQAGTPTISATSKGDSHPSVYFFCRDKGKSHLATTKPVKGCVERLVCHYNPSDRKYHCVDRTGASASPPGNVCKVNPHFACADAGPVVATPIGVEPDGQPQPAPPSTQAAPPPDTFEPPSQALPDTSSTTSSQPSPATSPTATPSSSPSPTIAADEPVRQALLQAKQRNLRVWLESDLVNAWKAGPSQLKAAAERLKLYANQPGVVGVKFAYDLGLRGFNTADEIARFVSETSQVLRATIPAGRRLAVDVVISELGCGFHQACVAAMRKAHPLLTRAVVERFVLSGDIDAVNVSPVPFGKEYEPFKIQPADAINNVWTQLRLLAWKTKMPGLFIGSREIGLAHDGETSPLKTAENCRESEQPCIDAKKLVRERVDTPLDRGADHIVLWTWKQSFNGQTWRLTDSGGRSNAVWDALRTRRNLLRVSVAYNPREPETNVADDVQRIGEVASAIFIFVPLGGGVR
ncbi:hypothetical protein [Nonomuraea sp. NPDC049400]|uniref:hypothetical protein n=1 Tax=Nonomuraea sp. NPDC049400 TaxID=3364352 RepID=UPI003792D17F